MKVLVVDDERDVQTLFEQKFRKERRAGEFQFEFAFSAENAIDYLQHNAADVVLILSDINMPGMNGIELLKIIKQDYDGMRVFMITAYGDENNYRSAMANGADGYLTKPLDFEELRAQMKILAKNNQE